MTIVSINPPSPPISVRSIEDLKWVLYPLPCLGICSDCNRASHACCCVPRNRGEMSNRAETYAKDQAPYFQDPHH